jgi:hypothetical protein
VVCVGGCCSDAFSHALRNRCSFAYRHLPLPTPHSPSLQTKMPSLARCGVLFALVVSRTVAVAQAVVIEISPFVSSTQTADCTTPASPPQNQESGTCAPYGPLESTSLCCDDGTIYQVVYAGTVCTPSAAYQVDTFPTNQC